MTMRVLRVRDGRLVLDAAAAAPIASADEAMLRPKIVAVHHADITATHDGVIAGRECVAEVVEPDGASRVRVGQRCILSPVFNCGACDLCRGGLWTHCERGRELASESAPGCLAERIAAAPVNLVDVPSTVADDAAAMAVAVGRAMHAIRCGGEGTRGYVTIIGDGATALLAGQILLRTNRQVRIAWARPRTVETCERWRIAHRNLAEIGRRGDQDVVIDARGDAASATAAMAMLKPRGCLVLAAVPPPSANLDSAPIRDRELHVVGSRGVLIREALALLAARHIDVGAISSVRCRLDDLPATLAREKDAVRILVEV